LQDIIADFVNFKKPELSTLILCLANSSLHPNHLNPQVDIFMSR